MTLKIGDYLEVSVFDLTLQGIGVARCSQKVIFIAGLLPGETGLARIAYCSREACIAISVSDVSQTSLRHKSHCIVSNDCGGCVLQPLDETAQVSWKQHHVIEVVKRIGNLDTIVMPLITSNKTFEYRNKALIPLERTQNGRLRTGFYRAASHYIVNINKCPLLDLRIDSLIEPIKADLETTIWPVNVNNLQSGGLRHLCIKVGVTTGEVLITLISSHSDLPGISELAQHWIQRWPQVVGVSLNIQPESNNVILGTNTRVIAGRPWLIERFCNLNLRITTDTFFQVNNLQAERTIEVLTSILGVSKGSTIIDAYCGVGTISLPLAAAGAQVIGLELQQSSVIHAQLNAKLNSINSAKFKHVDVSKALALHLPYSQALVVDPPRKGLQTLALEQIIATPVPKIAYLSCNPATLARDLRSITLNRKIKLVFIQPIDFFPQTTHVECLAILRSE